MNEFDKTTFMDHLIEGGYVSEETVNEFFDQEGNLRPEIKESIERKIEHLEARIKSLEERTKKSYKERTDLGKEVT